MNNSMLEVFKRAATHFQYMASTDTPDVNNNHSRYVCDFLSNDAGEEELARACVIRFTNIFRPKGIMSMFWLFDGDGRDLTKKAYGVRYRALSALVDDNQERITASKEEIQRNYHTYMDAE